MHCPIIPIRDLPMMSLQYSPRPPNTAPLDALPLPTLRIFGLRIVNARRDAALDWLDARLYAATPTRVAFVNAHCINVAAADLPYRTALITADALLPNGSGFALAGDRLAENLNGTDLVPALCRRLAHTGRSIYLLGGRPGVAHQAAATLQRLCHGLRIAGTRHGYSGPGAEDDVIADINASGASVLLVGLGVPMQDRWLARVATRLSPTLTMGVGGLFDFLSGRIPRAPATLRRSGLEWTYGLYQQPARMWRRYLVGNPAFIGGAVMAAAAAHARKAHRPVKRLTDIVGAPSALLLFAPLLLPAAALVRLTSPGPTFLRQTRVGEDGVPFAVVKLRSVYFDAAAPPWNARTSTVPPRSPSSGSAIPAHPSRPPYPQRVGRRAAATLERAHQRHVPGRPHAPALSPPYRQARPHLPLAGLRAPTSPSTPSATSTSASSKHTAWRRTCASFC